MGDEPKEPDSIATVIGTLAMEVMKQGGWSAVLLCAVLYFMGTWIGKPLVESHMEFLNREAKSTQTQAEANQQVVGILSDMKTLLAVSNKNDEAMQKSSQVLQESVAANGKQIAALEKNDAERLEIQRQTLDVLRRSLPANCAPASAPASAPSPPAPKPEG